ncbi:MAG: hypothetical protein QNJ37_18020 [Crocosphaera sp.]|nr:hypothetical protein [Crocosphaera sp.]
MEKPSAISPQPLAYFANRIRGDRFHLLPERRTLTAECLRKEGNVRKNFL